MKNTVRHIPADAAHCEENEVKDCTAQHMIPTENGEALSTGQREKYPKIFDAVCEVIRCINHYWPVPQYAATMPPDREHIQNLKGKLEGAWSDLRFAENEAHLYCPPHSIEQAVQVREAAAIEALKKVSCELSMPLYPYTMTAASGEALRAAMEKLQKAIAAEFKPAGLWQDRNGMAARNGTAADHKESDRNEVVRVR